MPVIVNEFEVITSAPSAEAQTANAAPPQALTPEDIQRLLRQFAERRARLKAD